MKILFTGASSFTGYWMARELAEAGHEVVATFTHPKAESYEGLRGQRVQRVLPWVRPIFAVSTGSPSFLDLLRSEDWDLWAQHGAEAKDYKSLEFDWRSAVIENALQLEQNLTAFAKARGRAVVLTGTYFEAEEGAGTEPRMAFSPYGLSKTLTSQAYRFAAQAAGLTLAKYVFPNPVGPFEEPRLAASLVAAWKKDEVAQLHTPGYIRDNLPAPLLARDYVAFAEQASRLSPGTWTRRNPSGWVESVGVFAQRIADEFGRRSGKTFAVRGDAQTIWREPKDRHNLHPCLALFSAEEQRAFWDAWHAYYFESAIHSADTPQKILPAIPDYFR